MYPAGPDEMIYIENDEEGIHFGAYLTSAPNSNISDSNETQLVAVISLFHEPFPPHLASLESLSIDNAKTLRFRKFACLKEYQGKGIGSQLFQSVVDYVRNDDSAKGVKGLDSKSGRMVWCAARCSAQDWYIKRGMRVFGDTYMKGDLEYVIMGIII